jgi:hypothetical protein
MLLLVTVCNSDFNGGYTGINIHSLGCGLHQDFLPDLLVTLNFNKDYFV